MSLTSATLRPYERHELFVDAIHHGHVHHVHVLLSRLFTRAVRQHEPSKQVRRTRIERLMRLPDLRLRSVLGHGLLPKALPPLSHESLSHRSTLASKDQLRQPSGLTKRDPAK